MAKKFTWHAIRFTEWQKISINTKVLQIFGHKWFSRVHYYFVSFNRSMLYIINIFWTNCTLIGSVCKKCAIFNWFAHLSKQHHKREESWFVQKARKLHDKLQWIVVYARTTLICKNCSPLNLSFSQMATFQRYHLKKTPKKLYTKCIIFWRRVRKVFSAKMKKRFATTYNSFRNVLDFK